MRRRSSWLLVLACAACLTPPPAGEGTKVPGADVDAPKRLRAPVDIGRVYAVGEIRQFEMRQAGQSIGTSWGRYVGPIEGGNHRFETRIELRLPGRAPARSEGELVLDARGRLVRGFERSNAAELVFERRGDSIVITDGERDDEVTYDPDRVDTAFMAHSAVVHAELMYALRPIDTAPMAWRLVSLSGGPPVEWTGRVLDATDDASTIRVDTSLGEVVTLVNGRIAAIDVEASDLRILAVDDPTWPSFTIAGPKRLVWTKPPHARFVVREVELPGKAEEPTLAGEVLVPEGASGPRPAVLLLSATGQEDRHGFAGPPPVDLGTHELTDALADAGFVVLRFDERGRGKSGPGELGFVAQLADARRALAVLSIQPEVDPDRIVVVGHGEGGLRALSLAAERAADVHAIVLLATPGRPYEQVLRAQAAARLDELPPDVRDDARVQQNAMIDELVKGNTPAELEPQAKWLREIFAVRPAELVARVKVPVLLAQGGKDFEVDPVADVIPLEKAAKRARVKLEVRRYDALDHLFKPEPGTSTPERYRVERAVDTTFITDVVAWTRRVTKSK